MPLEALLVPLAADGLRDEAHAPRRLVVRDLVAGPDAVALVHQAPELLRRQGLVRRRPLAVRADIRRRLDLPRLLAQVRHRRGRRLDELRLLPQIGRLGLLLLLRFRLFDDLLDRLDGLRLLNLRRLGFRLRGLGLRLRLRRRRVGIGIRVVRLLRPRRHDREVHRDDHVGRTDRQLRDDPEEREDGEVQGEREAEGPQRDGAPPLRTPLPRLFVCVHATFPSSRAPSCARGSRRRPSRRPSPRRIRGVRRHARARARRDRPPPWRPGRP